MRGEVEAVWDCASGGDVRMAERLVEGDHSALSELFARHGRAMRASVARITCDPANAEDVVQEVLLGLWRRPESYEPTRGALGPWLQMRCRGVAIDRIRHQVRSSRREVFVRVGERDIHEDDYLDVGDRSAIHTALTTLPGVDRALIELTFFRGLTYRAAAESLHMPEGTAKSRIRRILLVLRDRVGAAASCSSSERAPYC